MFELKDGIVTEFEINAKEFGIASSTLEDVRGGDAAQNLATMKELFAGKAGAVRDIVTFNAGCALYVSGVAGDVMDGIERARRALPTGPSLTHCEECGKPIPAARQKAVPGVRLCVACQEAADAVARAARDSAATVRIAFMVNSWWGEGPERSNENLEVEGVARQPSDAGAGGTSASGKAFFTCVPA
mgnify:CR=1 FL=1